MHKLPFALALVAAFSTAGHAESYKIIDQGQDIDVQVTTQANGSRKISGINNRTGETFLLIATDQRVWGRYGETDVAFTTPMAREYKPAPDVLAST